MSDDLRTTATVQSLWQAVDATVQDVVLQACPVSGNNRVYVASSGQRQVVAKVYFPVADGEVDRLDAEWLFLSHASRSGLRCVPKAIACDKASRIALYEYIAGEKLHSSDIGESDVLQAADFIAALNAPQAAASAATLPPAREACFTVSSHLAMLDRRFARFSVLDGAVALSDEDRQALIFIEKLKAEWSFRRSRIVAVCDDWGLGLDTPVSDGERLVSPSDFGFHNALRTPEGRQVFIDFEYAGWDDVAKLVADFFYQPAIPVNRVYSAAFINRVLAHIEDQATVRRRIDLLRPVFGLKWCCIMLNRFLPDMAQRAAFADPDQNVAERKRQQLEKARSAFETVVNEAWLI